MPYSKHFYKLDESSLGFILKVNSFKYDIQKTITNTFKEGNICMININIFKMWLYMRLAVYSVTQ